MHRFALPDVKWTNCICRTVNKGRPEQLALNYNWPFLKKKQLKQLYFWHELKSPICSACAINMTRPSPYLQTVQVSKITHELKPFRTDYRRRCRPTSGCTIPGDGCFTPRWFRSWPTCAASTRSTPNSTAPCPSSRSTACSSPRWCWRCLAARSPRRHLTTVTLETREEEDSWGVGGGGRAKSRTRVWVRPHVSVYVRAWFSVRPVYLTSVSL